MAAARPMGKNLSKNPEILYKTGKLQNKTNATIKLPLEKERERGKTTVKRNRNRAKNSAH